MKKIDVVIGAGYGDEGKGLFTNYFTERQSTVVRFNGGAQAGHTVTTHDGKRHVFSHFGSGTIKGAQTYLSKFFVVNPTLFEKEYLQLEAKGYRPIVRVDPRCYVTTPYDMLINQAIEEHRGTLRHGSCGVGINETIERSTAYNDNYTLLVSHLDNDLVMRMILNRIRNEYVRERLIHLGVPMSPFVKSILESDNVLDNFLTDCMRFYCSTWAIPFDHVATDHLVFEGAQGLMLDQSNFCFPYVTRSNTGMQNVAELISEFDIGELNVLYATRAYTTRHGAGPMFNELPHKPYANIFDLTNIPNEYQGSLRFAYLDTEVLSDAIIADEKFVPKDANVNLGITCIDQLDEIAYLYGYADSELLSETKDEFASAVHSLVNSRFQKNCNRTMGLYVSQSPISSQIIRQL